MAEGGKKRAQRVFFNTLVVAYSGAATGGDPHNVTGSS